MSFGTLAANARKVDTYEILRDILFRKDIQEFIKNAPKNRIQQTGIAADGTKLRTDKSASGEFYSEFTIFLKEDSGQETGHVTLTDSGKFWRDVFIRIERDRFILDSIFEKPEGNIFDNFSFQFSSGKEFEDAVLGLNELEQDQLAGMIYPHFKRELENRI